VQLAEQQRSELHLPGVLMRATARVRVAWLLAAALATGCGKFQQAKECGAFVKTVNGWLAQGNAPPKPANAAPIDPAVLAAESRELAGRYDELAGKLADLHVTADELLPRVSRYQQLTRDAAHALRQTADALDHRDLETARQKRVDFDTIAQREEPLVKEINGLCR
jgi:hypothetical protein